MASIRDIQQHGLASKVKVGCKCGKQEAVVLETDNGSSSRVDNRGGCKKYDLTRRLAPAMVEGAMGTDQVQDFLTVLLSRMPPSKRLIQDSERQYGQMTKLVADASMESVRSTEKKLTHVNAHMMVTKAYDETPKPIIRAIDGTYTRRGFNSDNGMVDEASTSVKSVTGGAAIANAIPFSRGCATCDKYLSSGTEPPTHKCGIDFRGSARSMEPIGAKRMEHINRSEGCGSNRLVGDEDADVAKALIDEWGDEAPDKDSDPNHFKGSLKRKMIGGKKTVHHVKASHSDWAKGETKLKQYPAAAKRMEESAIGPMAADYLCALFLVVIHTHNDAIEMHKAFKVAINHAFNDHSGCNVEWCTSLSSDPVKKATAFNRLPQKKPLVGKKLLSLLLDMVDEFCPPTVCKRLLHRFHSQNCESLHNMIHSKAPKNRAQVSGSVFAGRALRAVVVKNLGPQVALEKILEAQGLSPSKAVSQHYDRKLKKRKDRNSRAATPEYKRHRKALKYKKKMLNRNSEATEAYTYAKDVELLSTICEDSED